MKKAFSSSQMDAVKTLLKDRFTPGDLFAAMTEQNIKLKMDADTFLGDLLAICSRHQETDYGHGYWSDHWHYNIDLLENYLAFFPEKTRYMLMDNKNFTFFVKSTCCITA